MKVLVVDDERTIAHYLAEILYFHGHQALPLYSAADALEHVEVLNFDVALIGYIMPRMVGTEAAKLIKSVSPHTKIAIIAEEVPAEVRKALQREGFEFDYLPAPFEAKVLLGKLNEYQEKLQVFPQVGRPILGPIFH